MKANSFFRKFRSSYSVMRQHSTDRRGKEQVAHFL